MKKFIIAIITVLLFANVNVKADESVVSKIAKNLENSTFFTDNKDLNSDKYSTSIKYKDDTIAIVGKYKGKTDYILYYVYNNETGILSYEMTDLTLERDELNLQKHIVAALIWNKYVIDAVNDYYVEVAPNDYRKGEFLNNFRTIDPCTLTLNENGIEIVDEAINSTRLAAIGREITTEAFYTTLKLNLKSGIKIDKGQVKNPLTEFDSGKIDNPSTGVIKTVVFVVGGVLALSIIVLSYNNVRKLKLEEAGER